jgi:hypothetical protein
LDLGFGLGLGRPSQGGDSGQRGDNKSYPDDFHLTPQKVVKFKKLDWRFFESLILVLL